MIDLFLDVETIPTNQPEFINRLKVEPPANITKPETLAKWWNDKKPALLEKKVKSTALDSTKGELLCISFAIGESVVVNVSRDQTITEATLLKQFYETLREHIENITHAPIRWIGHNITAFDIPFLWHRSLVNNIKPSLVIPHGFKQFDHKIYDTLRVWRGYSTAASSLEDVCTALGIPYNKGLHGSEVWEYYLKGNIKPIINACNNDVICVRQLYKRMTAQ